jgi:hypothetical protein
MQNRYLSTYVCDIERKILDTHPSVECKKEHILKSTLYNDFLLELTRALTFGIAMECKIACKHLVCAKKNHDGYEKQKPFHAIQSSWSQLTSLEIKK